MHGVHMSEGHYKLYGMHIRPGGLSGSRVWLPGGTPSAHGAHGAHSAHSGTHGSAHGAHSAHGAARSDAAGAL